MAFKIETIDDLENLPVKIALVGATMRDSGEGKQWECDQWRVFIGQGTLQFTTNYFTGIGHRKAPKYGWGEARPVKPKNADVLHSLVMDAEADGMSFPDWCENYGFSDGSFKAHNTYMACCKIAKGLRQVFTRDEMKKIREILQEY